MKAICLNVRQKKNKFILILLEKLQVKRVLKTERHRRENNTEYSFGWKWNAMIKAGSSQKTDNEKFIQNFRWKKPDVKWPLVTLLHTGYKDNEMEITKINANVNWTEAAPEWIQRWYSNDTNGSLNEW